MTISSLRERSHLLFSSSCLDISDGRWFCNFTRYIASNSKVPSRARYKRVDFHGKNWWYHSGPSKSDYRHHRNFVFKSLIIFFLAPKKVTCDKSSGARSDSLKINSQSPLHLCELLKREIFFKQMSRRVGLGFFNETTCVHKNSSKVIKEKPVKIRRRHCYCLGCHPCEATSKYCLVDSFSWSSKWNRYGRCRDYEWKKCREAFSEKLLCKHEWKPILWYMFGARERLRRSQKADWKVIGQNGKPKKVITFRKVYYWGLLPRDLFLWIMKTYLN